MIMNRKYIFTVTTGRSGQDSFSHILNKYVRNSYVAFEYPQIDYFFSGHMADIERIFRRKFIETNELLGRGKVLAGFVDNNVEYISRIVQKRLDHIYDHMRINNSHVYIDVSKYFARGLHLGFIEKLSRFSLIHLVRDPVLNMRSFLNRNKNFYLDNNDPSDESNILVMDSMGMSKPELYLWSWFEMALRYENMKNMECVDKFIEIETQKLNNPSYINNKLDAIGLDHSLVQDDKIIMNTNMENGYTKTK